MNELFRRIHSLLNRRSLEQHLEDEMAFHREMLSPEERRGFGNSLLLREQARDAWGWTWLDHLTQDLRFGARLMQKSPAFVLAAVAVLALGIGVNVTGFNLVNMIFFRPLPVRDPHSIVRFTITSPTSSSTEVPYPAAEFYARAGAAISAILTQTSTNVTVTGEPNQSVRAGVVSPNYFAELGSRAAYGRLFDPRIDGRPDSPLVVVLGYRYWNNYFASDPTVVGRVIRLNERAATVIGVLGYDFTGLAPEQGVEDALWLTIPELPYFVPETRLLTSFDGAESGVHMWARLKPGISQPAAESALKPLSDELVHEHPDVLPRELRLVARPGAYAATLEAADSDLLPVFGLFATLVLLILSVACGNLGNLLMGHAANREREVSIRLALGASRRRIVRQFMTENLLLALLGSVAGWFLSWLVSHPLLVWLGAPENLQAGLDWRIALFTAALGVIACVLFGLSPARQAARLFRHRSRARSIFMIAQVAASCVLLVVSALLVRSLHHALKSDPGFDYSHIIAIDPELYAHGYSGPRAATYMQQLESRLQQVPGTTAMAQAWVAPLGDHISMKPASGDLAVNLHFNAISPGFFAAMGIPIINGRDLTDEDRDVAVVSAAAAHALWPGKDPLQQIYTYGQRKLPVIGVVGNARLVQRRGDDATLYMPLQSKQLNATTLLVRTSQPPEALLAGISHLAQGADRSLSPNVQTMASIFREQIGESEKLTVIVTGMGGLALGLALIGVYGIVGYSVSQRSHEIGIRMALGATPSRLVRHLLSAFARPFGIAMASGLVLAAGLSILLRRELYGVSNWDGFSYAASILLLLITSGLAALLPARRALRVDPAATLRHD